MNSAAHLLLSTNCPLTSELDLLHELFYAISKVVRLNENHQVAIETWNYKTGILDSVIYFIAIDYRFFCDILP